MQGSGHLSHRGPGWQVAHTEPQRSGLVASADPRHWEGQRAGGTRGLAPVNTITSGAAVSEMHNGPGTAVAGCCFLQWRKLLRFSAEPVAGKAETPAK